MAKSRLKRNLLLIIPIIIFGFLTIINFLGTRNGCYTMAGTFFGIFTAFMTIAYSLILSLIFAYFSIFKKEKFNFLPILTFGLVGIIFLLTQHFDNEKYKSDIIIKANASDSDAGENRENISLILRENKKFSLRKSESHYGCVEKGTYILVNDTLILTRKEKSYVKGLDFIRLLIDFENNEIYVLNDNNEIDSTIILKIE